jgi:hypothetical protein
LAAILAILNHSLVLSKVPEPILLLPKQPQVVSVRPYDVYDVYIPVESLQNDEDYWIKTSFEGGLAIEIVMKRKVIEHD